MSEEANDGDQVSISCEDGVVIARVFKAGVGQNDAARVIQQIRVAIESLAERLRYLVIDLSEVDFLPSVGIDLCVNVRNRAHILGADGVIVTGLNDRLERLFTIMKLDAVFTVVQDPSDLDRITSGE